MGIRDKIIVQPISVSERLRRAKSKVVPSSVGTKSREIDHPPVVLTLERMLHFLYSGPV